MHYNAWIQQNEAENCIKSTCTQLIEHLYFPPSIAQWNKLYAIY